MHGRIYVLSWLQCFQSTLTFAIIQASKVSTQNIPSDVGALKDVT